MSRPTGSVPRRKRQLPAASHAGGVSVNSRYCSLGGCGEMTSAPSASASSTPTRVRPMIAPRFWANARQNSRHRDGGAVSVAAIAAIVGAASAMANPRVDDAVQHVDDQVHRNDDRRDEQNAALHHRIVARLDAMNEPVANARPGKDRLG